MSDTNKVDDWAARFQQLKQSSRHALLQRYYGAGMVAADTPISEVPMVALDLETTGLDEQQDDIVSIGLVPFNSSRIRCAGAQHWIVKPRRQLDEQSIVIHRITHSDIRQAPDLDEVLDDLLAKLAGKLVVVHFRRIERNFLHKAMMERIGEGIQFPVIDTMAIEHQVLQDHQSLLAKMMRRQQPSLRLPNCRARYGLPAYQLHHATIDAIATAELLQAQLAHHFAPDVPVGQLWC